MKEKILRALRSTGQEYVSGAALCETLGVSRQAVWKNITALREQGYQIESVTNKGYRLTGLPDRLYGPDIMSRLPENGFCRRVVCYEEIDSTNTEAKRLAEQGEQEGTLVVADKQTAGKGRRGRDWSSLPGIGIYMTLLLRPSIPTEKVSSITLVAALALTRAIREVCHADAQIKWPNDVVIHEKKACGILTEMSSEEGYIHYIVVGIGVNANTREFPDELCNKATSIYLETGTEVDRAELTARITEYFGVYYEKYCQTQSMRLLMEEYNAFLVNKDREVCVYYGMQEDSGHTDTGIARGINADGALLVEIDGSQKEIVSGEVSVRGRNGYV